MKKLLFVLGAGLFLGTTISCNHTGAAGKYEKVLGDSLSLAFGQSTGRNIQEMVERQKARSADDAQNELNIEKFMKGMQVVLEGDTTDNYAFISGMSFALQRLLQTKVEMAVDTVPFDTRLFLKGFKEAYEDTTPTNKYQTVLSELQSNLSVLHHKKEEARMAVERVKNGEAGAAYVDSVKASDLEVKTSESGLVYKILEPGTERKVEKTDRIKLNYKGYTIDGKVFDETNGNPRSTGAAVFIPGFNEGISLLGEGGKAILYIPGELAYGDRGIPQKNIGANTTLIFEIEVVEVTPQEDTVNK